MCDTDSASNLFFIYMEKIKEHLVDVDHLYSILFSHQDQNIKYISNQFMAVEQIIFVEKRWR